MLLNLMQGEGCNLADFFGLKRLYEADCGPG